MPVFEYDYPYSDEELIITLNNGNSLTSILRQLRIKNPYDRDYKAIRLKIKKLGLNVEHLKSNRNISTSEMVKNQKDLIVIPTLKIGSEIGKLKIISLGPSASNGDKQWVCLCCCGNQKLVRASSLRCGDTKSCGCLSKEEQLIYTDKNDIHRQRKERKLIRQKERYATDPLFAMKRRLSARIYQSLRSRNFKKSDATEKLVGCTMSELKLHIEKQFKDGMSWELFHAIDIDHIIPCASFDLTDPEQQKKCFHYTNLQPLWREDNKKKGDYVPDTFSKF